MATEKNAATAAQSATKVIIGSVTKPVRFSYCHVFEPAAMEGSDKKKYSVSIIIDKDDKETIAKIEAAVEAAKEQGKGKSWGGKIPANLKLPLRDGDKDRPDDENYKGKFFVTGSSNTKPGIIDKAKNAITEETEFYSGVYGRASLNFYPFNSNGSKGVACGLNNLQKLADGEALGGKSRAEDDFDDLEDDQDDIV